MSPRFLECNPMVQILVVRRKALRRLVETLGVLWKVCLVGLAFPVLAQAVKGLKCRQTVGCEPCKGRRRRRCGMGLVAKLGSWMGRLGGWQVGEGTNGDRGVERGLGRKLCLLMVGGQGMGRLGAREGGLETIRAWESGLETWWEGGLQMGSWLVWLVNRGGRRW